MKKPAILLAAFGLTLIGSLHAQSVPSYLSYQGKVTTGTGAPLGSAGTAPNLTAAPINRKMLFRIFDTPAPIVGQALTLTPMWTEQQTVTVSLGEFSVLLGQGSGYLAEPHAGLDTVFANIPAPLPPGFPNVPPSGPLRYLEITVDNGDGTFNTSDTPIIPRQRLTTAAYAFRARMADTVTPGSIVNNQLQDGSISLLKMQTNSVNGDKIVDESVATGDLADGAVDATKLAASVSGGLWSVSANGTSVYRPAGTNVGIGTATPVYPLSFPPSPGDKICFWNPAAPGSNYGIGIAASQLQIHTDQAISDVVFGWGTSAALTETMRIKGNGRVGIGKNNPAVALDVVGAITATGALTAGSISTAGSFAAGAVRVNDGAPAASTGFAFSGSAGLEQSGMFADADGTLKFFTNNVERVRIASSGRTFINPTVNSTDRLAVSLQGNTGGDAFRIDDGFGGRTIRMWRSTTGLVIWGNVMSQAGNGNSQIQWDGDGNWDQSSDRTLKKDITDAESVLGRLMQLPVRRFHWKESSPDKPKSFGVIAQEVKPLFPDIVGAMTLAGSDKETMTVKYGSFGLIAAKAVQELKNEKDAEVKTLQEENAALKKQLAAQEQRLAELEAGEKTRETKLAAIEKLLQAAAATDSTARTVSLNSGAAVK